MKITTLMIVFTLLYNIHGDEIEQLRNEVKSLKSMVYKMKSTHNESLNHYIKNEIDIAIKKDSNKLLTLSTNATAISIKGDMRWRYHRDEFNTSGAASQTESRDRIRLMFRLGFIWKTNEGWEIGAGFATGDTGNSFNGRSTNSDVGKAGPFSNADLVLDYAYAKHKWASEDSSSSLTLGQMKNPFYTSPTMWDSDLRPTGAAYQWNKELTNSLKYFITTGLFTVVHNNNGRGNNDTLLYSLQTGFKGKNYTFAFAYHHFTGDLYENLAGEVSNASSSMNYRLVDIYADYTYELLGYKWKVMGHLIHNLSAENQDSHLAEVSSKEASSYIAGLKWFIDSKLSLSLQYRHMAAHGQPANLVEGNFGSNQKGYAVVLTYNLSKNMFLKLNYFASQEIAQSSDSPDEHESFIIDVIYKF